MRIFIFTALLLFIGSLSSQDFGSFYSEYKVKGSFVMYDMKGNKFSYYDSARCYNQFTPASTFKIPNSIIGLETGVIKDENFVIPWDSVVRPVAVWNQDMDLKAAIKVSCVPYYQELARRVGGEKMQDYINKFNYGNKNISGGIDKFWLSGGMRISQMEEIDFLIRFYNEELPVSKRSMDITKSIMLREDTLGYKIYAKTGWGDMNDTSIGWYVGWVEKDGNAYIFANNIETASPGDNFPAARIEITNKILKALGVI